MYHVSALGVDVCMINVHYYCYYDADTFILEVYRPSIIHQFSLLSFLLSPFKKKRKKHLYLHVCVRVLACVCVDS